MHSPAKIAAKRGKKVEEVLHVAWYNNQRDGQGAPGQGPARAGQPSPVGAALGLNKLNDVRELEQPAGPWPDQQGPLPEGRGISIMNSIR